MRSLGVSRRQAPSGVFNPSGKAICRRGRSHISLLRPQQEQRTPARPAMRTTLLVSPSRHMVASRRGNHGIEKRQTGAARLIPMLIRRFRFSTRKRHTTPLVLGPPSARFLGKFGLSSIFLIEPSGDFLLSEPPMSSDLDGWNLSAFRPQAQRSRGNTEPSRDFARIQKTCMRVR